MTVSLPQELTSPNAPASGEILQLPRPSGILAICRRIPTGSPGSRASRGKRRRHPAKCQNAIAKAGRTLLVKSILARAKCATKDFRNKTCDPAAKVTKAENQARTQIVKGCSGATLSNLNSGSCEASSSSTTELASGIVDSHGSAVLDLITDQFGRSVSSSSVTVAGNLTSSIKTHRVGPHLKVAGVTTDALALTDLRLYV